jgi:hypothetical protein
VAAGHALAQAHPGCPQRSAVLAHVPGPGRQLQPDDVLAWLGCLGHACLPLARRLDYPPGSRPAPRACRAGWGRTPRPTTSLRRPTSLRGRVAAGPTMWLQPVPSAGPVRSSFPDHPPAPMRCWSTCCWRWACSGSALSLARNTKGSPPDKLATDGSPTWVGGCRSVNVATRRALTSAFHERCG